MQTAFTVASYIVTTGIYNQSSMVEDALTSRIGAIFISLIAMPMTRLQKTCDVIM